jgi:hypothetical protein
MDPTLQDGDRVADDIGHQVRLTQLARGKPFTFWHWALEHRAKPFLGGIGLVMVMYEVAWSAPHDWLVLAGLLLMLFGFRRRRDDQRERVDALVELLDRKGLLDVPGAEAEEGS